MHHTIRRSTYDDLPAIMPVIDAARIIQPKVLFPYHYSQTDVSGIAAQLPDIDVRIRHYE